MLKKLKANYKEIDIFTSPIKWKFLSQEDYKSNFGATFTIILYIFFILKAYLFINKILSYGFAQDTMTKGFFDENYQITNFSDFKLVFFAPKIKELTKKYSSQLGYSAEELQNFNLKDFLNIDDYAFTHKSNSKLKMIEVPCQLFSNLGNLTINLYDEFICYKFEENFNFFNISLSQTFFAIDEEKGIYSKEHIRDLNFFEFRISYTEKFYNFLRIVPEASEIVLLLENWDMDFSNYSLKASSRVYSYVPELLMRNLISLDMQKITVAQYFDLDFVTPELIRNEKFNFPLHGYMNNLVPRNLNGGAVKPYDEDLYFDFVDFDFDVFEELHTVNYLTLDDIFSVLGGFMNIIISVCSFFGVTYNESDMIKIFNKHYTLKESQYAENFYEIKKSFLTQNGIREKDIKGEIKDYNSDNNNDIMSANKENLWINSNEKKNQKSKNNISNYKNINDENVAHNNYIHNSNSIEIEIENVNLTEQQIEMKHKKSFSSISVSENKSKNFFNFLIFRFYSKINFP